MRQTFSSSLICENYQHLKKKLTWNTTGHCPTPSSVWQALHSWIIIQYVILIAVKHGHCSCCRFSTAINRTSVEKACDVTVMRHRHRWTRPLQKVVQKWSPGVWNLGCFYGCAQWKSVVLRLQRQQRGLTCQQHGQDQHVHFCVPRTVLQCDLKSDMHAVLHDTGSMRMHLLDDFFMDNR